MRDHPHPGETLDVPECPICLSGRTYLDLERDDDCRLTSASFYCRECGYRWENYELASKLLAFISEEVDEP